MIALIRSRIAAIERPGIAGLAISLIAGALMPFSMAPWFYWPLGLLSVALFWLALNQTNSRQALLRGWFFGFGCFGVGASWVYVSIAHHSNTPTWLSILLTLIFISGLACFFVLFSLLYQRWLRAKLAGPTLGFTALWIILEWFRSWFLTGFPWLYLGDAHLYTPLSGWAPLLGSMGLSFWVVLGTTLVLHAWRHQHHLLPAVLIAILPWGIGYGLTHIDWTYNAHDRLIRIAAVQGNIDQEYKWKPEAITPTLKKYQAATQSMSPLDLIVWPETAITLLYHLAQPVLQNLNKKHQQTHSNLITGIPYQHSDLSITSSAYYNSVLGLGLANGIYHKQKLVPFGEYVPFGDQLRNLISFFNLPMSSFTRGDKNQLPINIQVDGHRFQVAPFICYEIAYPQLVATMAEKAQLLVTISNDSWFGDSIGPKQHLALAQMRALENGRYLIRATNTGITALVDAKGNLIQQLPTNTAATLTGEAELRQGLTPFTQYGYWPMVITCLLSTLLVACLRPRICKLP